MRVASIPTSLTCAALLTFAGGCADKSLTTEARSSRSRAHIAMAIAAQTGTPGRVVDIRVGYNRDTVRIPISSTTIPVTQEDNSVSLPADIAACLSDSTRGGDPGVCLLRITVVLREQGGLTLDSTDIGPLIAAPGRAVTAQSITLAAADSVAISLPATMTAADTAIAAVSLFTRGGSPVGTRPVTWSSSNSAVASVSSAGVVSARARGTATIRAVSAGGSNERQVTVQGVNALAHYPFDGNVLDASGNGRNGNAQGLVPSADRLGRANRAFLFGGHGASNMSVASLDLADEYTIAAFIRVDGFPGVAYAIVSRYDALAVTGYELLVTIPQEGQALRLHSGVGVMTATDNPIQLGRWYFVAATVSQGVGTLYIDGLPVLSAPIASATPNALGTFIGRSAWSPSNNAAGAMDELSIFNRALSAAEIAALFQAGGRPAGN